MVACWCGEAFAVEDYEVYFADHFLYCEAHIITDKAAFTLIDLVATCIFISEIIFVTEANSTHNTDIAFTFYLVYADIITFTFTCLAGTLSTDIVHTFYLVYADIITDNTHNTDIAFTSCLDYADIITFAFTCLAGAHSTDIVYTFYLVYADIIADSTHNTDIAFTFYLVYADTITFIFIDLASNEVQSGLVYSLLAMQWITVYVDIGLAPWSQMPTL